MRLALERLDDVEGSIRIPAVQGGARDSAHAFEQILRRPQAWEPIPHDFLLTCRRLGVPVGALEQLVR